MAINFSGLPTQRPNALPATGTYYATIDSAEMKQGQDPTKPPYLNIALSLKDKQGKACGKIFDMLAESDKELVQYKIARFLIALGLDKLGTFELVDLVKIIKGKQLIVDVKQEEEGKERRREGRKGGRKERHLISIRLSLCNNITY